MKSYKGGNSFELTSRRNLYHDIEAVVHKVVSKQRQQFHQRPQRMFAVEIELFKLLF
jgi:hypothetical protein